MFGFGRNPGTICTNGRGEKQKIQDPGTEDPDRSQPDENIQTGWFS